MAVQSNAFPIIFDSRTLHLQWYVANTNGPAIIAFTSSEDRRFITEPFFICLWSLQQAIDSF